MTVAEKILQDLAAAVGVFLRYRSPIRSYGYQSHPHNIFLFFFLLGVLVRLGTDNTADGDALAAEVIILLGIHGAATRK